MDAGQIDNVGTVEGTDPNGEDGNGIYRKSRKGENCLSWIAYLVGVK